MTDRLQPCLLLVPYHNTVAGKEQLNDKVLAISASQTNMLKMQSSETRMTASVLK